MSFILLHICIMCGCILTPLLFSGQYEHFRNRESVFKEYRPYFEHEGRNMSAVTGQSVHLPCGVRNLGDRYVSA